MPDLGKHAYDLVYLKIYKILYKQHTHLKFRNGNQQVLGPSQQVLCILKVEKLDCKIRTYRYVHFHKSNQIIKMYVHKFAFSNVL